MASPVTSCLPQPQIPPSVPALLSPSCGGLLWTVFLLHQKHGFLRAGAGPGHPGTQAMVNKCLWTGRRGRWRRERERRIKVKEVGRDKHEAIKCCLADACAKPTETNGVTHQISTVSISMLQYFFFSLHPGPKKPFLKIQWKKHFWNGGLRTSEILFLHKNSKNTRTNWPF